MKALRRFLVQQAWPRRARIIKQWQTVLALCTVAAVAAFGDNVALRHLAADKLVTAVFAYAALALGACLTGLTVSLTLPDRSFANYLAKQANPKQSDENPYADLVFVFSWTALAHWLVIALSLVTFVVVGESDVPTFDPDCSASAMLVAVLLGAMVYAMAQFMVTIITLSEVAEVYIAWLRRDG